jgi:hypothetical protein
LRGMSLGYATPISPLSREREREKWKGDTYDC